MNSMSQYQIHPVNPKLRAILDQIDDVLAGDDTETSVQLWDVLSALRGPDYRGNKDATTNYIRHAAFPKMASLPSTDSIRSYCGANARVNMILNNAGPLILESYAHNHFYNHIDLAFVALGFKKRSH